ncbi:hypothetical protein [Rosistilla oblonga]|uniref:hypothetical protein n=1 Tax=Rosistilla oblonga TaxID=2527990 RepID=UPI003A96B9CE
MGAEQLLATCQRLQRRSLLNLVLGWFTRSRSDPSIVEAARITLAVLNSMTPAERRSQTPLRRSAERRISAGSGTSLRDVRITLSLLANKAVQPLNDAFRLHADG